MAAQQPRRPDRPTRRAPERAVAGRPAGGWGRVAGRLGHAAAVVAGRLARAGRRLLAAAAGETGRRVGRAVALSMVLAVLVVTLYERGEAPRAAAQPAVGGAAPAAGGPGGPETRRRQGAAAGEEPGGLRGRARPATAGERPAEVAAAWYAARHGLPRHRVRPLQQDRLSARELRVLVLADHGPGRLQTALVRVRLTASGWRVR